jgi:hypothetical protein
MDEDLLGNDCCIGGCHGGGAGEDHDAQAEKEAHAHQSEDPGEKPTPWKLDERHI